MFVVHLRDGRTIREGEMDWKAIPHQDITSLQLLKHGKTYTVSVDGANVKLLQLKRNVLNTLLGTDELTERVIGFVVGEKWAVKMEVDEVSGNVRLTLEEKMNKGWRKL